MLRLEGEATPEGRSSWARAAWYPLSARRQEGYAVVKEALVAAPTGINPFESHGMKKNPLFAGTSCALGDRGTEAFH
jgi:hypothetical protein